MPGKKRAKLAHEKIKTDYSTEEVSKYVTLTRMDGEIHKVESLTTLWTKCGRTFNKYHMGIVKDITCEECK